MAASRLLFRLCANLVRAPAFRRGVALSLLSATAVEAADLLGQSPSRTSTTVADDWTGFYVGVHAGVASGHSTWSATQPGGAPNLSGSLDLFHAYDAFSGAGSHFGGLAAGYNSMLPSRLVIGVEADVSFPNTLGASLSFASPIIGAATYGDPVEMFGTVRGRVGYDANHWLYYATGGLAWTYDKFSRTEIIPGSAGGPPDGTVETAFAGRVGWTVGAGIEAPVAPGWTAKAEYLYSQFGNTGVAFPLGAQSFTSDLFMHEVRVGLNYRPGDSAKSDGVPFGISPLEVNDWVVRGQTTYVNQYAPPFHAPYRGANSLDSNTGRETWDATLYVGRRLWEGAELWIDPEIDQGFGLSGTLGVAGFTSGEAYKVGSTYPYLRLPRTFIRQTIDLGGDSQKVEADLNQFAGSQTANRVVITVGKFSVADIFDGNKYAHDPRSDFLNWSILDTGTFDYAAEPWGYTYGAAVEWYQGRWTARAGLFDLSIVPNNIELDPTFRQFQLVGEIEHRHELWGQPGKVAVTGFLTRGRMGRFDDALALAQATGTTPDTADVRRYSSRPGVSMNFEQQVVPNVGVFGRIGWADGNVEPYEFTDIDRTAAAGLSLSGKTWGRPDDTFGLAGVVNSISAAHIAYLNAGGLGILIGDGQLLHPGPEQIIETYYSFPIGSWRAAVDYQFIANPAYNRDRGPVSVIAMRLRAQF
jgi:high affinity Mn2+ porin